MFNPFKLRAEEAARINEIWASQFNALAQYHRDKLAEMDRFYNDRITAMKQMEAAYIRHLEQHVETLEAALRSRS